MSIMPKRCDLLLSYPEMLTQATCTPDFELFARKVHAGLDSSRPRTTDERAYCDVIGHSSLSLSLSLSLCVCVCVRLKMILQKVVGGFRRNFLRELLLRQRRHE